MDNVMYPDNNFIASLSHLLTRARVRERENERWRQAYAYVK